MLVRTAATMLGLRTVVDAVPRVALTSWPMSVPVLTARTRCGSALVAAVYLTSLTSTVLMTVGGRAHAQVPASQPAQASNDIVENARRAYAKGQNAFAQGDFAAAQTAFEEAYANVPNPIVLVSIGEAAAKQGKITTALAAYEQYLRVRPDAPDRADVEQKHAVLAQTPGEVAVTSEPAGADVIVDGRAVGQRTPTTLQIAPGAHRIEVVLAGHAGEAWPAEVSAGARAEHAFALHAQTPSPAAVTPTAESKLEEAPSAPDAATAGSPTAAIVITASLGAVGLIAGTALGILALTARSDYDQNPSAAKADDGERLALFSDVGFGIGAMALVTTAVLLFTRDASSSDSDKPDKQSAQLQFIPNVTPSGASASAKLRF